MTELYIERIYYHEMFSSARCWKNVPAVTQVLRRERTIILLRQRHPNEATPPQLGSAIPSRQRHPNQAAPSYLGNATLIRQRRPT